MWWEPVADIDCGELSSLSEQFSDGGVDVLGDAPVDSGVGSQHVGLALVSEGGAGGGHADFSPHSGSDSTYRSSSERANRLPECDLTGMTCPCACRSSSFLGDMSR